MNRIHTFVERAKTVAMAVVLFIMASVDAVKRLPVSSQPYGVTDFVFQIVVALLGALSIVVFEQVVNWTIGESRRLRRMIMGRQDIEGYWLETVRSEPNGEIVGFSVDSINFADYEFMINGREFDTLGNYRGSYWTVLHEYADYQSKLVFGSKHIGDPGQEKSGYSVVHYYSPNHQITGYIGYYTDTNMVGRLDVSGQRLTSPDEIALAHMVLDMDVVPESAEVALRLYRLKSQRLQQDMHRISVGNA